MSSINASFFDLTGRVFGTVQVGHIARRTPALAWHFRCNRCSTSGIVLHEVLVREGDKHKCPNKSCGRVMPPTPVSSGTVGHIATAIRSADSANARRYAAQIAEESARREQRKQLSEQDFRGADPDVLRRYLDRKEENERKR